MAKLIKPLSKADSRRYLEPYATKIGFVTLAWNHLHEGLAILFWYALGPGPTPWAIWHRQSSDRTQRDMLRAAVEAGAFLSGPNGQRLTNDILWILRKIDGLSDHRNNAIHAPLTTLTNTETGETVVTPEDFFGNKRAKNFANKQILKELDLYAEAADALSEFAFDLVQFMRPSKDPWPARPTLPAISSGKKKPNQ
jgi:hypothetical protein